MTIMDNVAITGKPVLNRFSLPLELSFNLICVSLRFGEPQWTPLPNLSSYHKLPEAKAKP